MGNIGAGFAVYFLSEEEGTGEINLQAHMELLMQHTSVRDHTAAVRISIRADSANMAKTWAVLLIKSARVKLMGTHPGIIPRGSRTRCKAHRKGKQGVRT